MSVISWIWVLWVQISLGSKHFKDGHSIWERLDRGLAINS